VSGTVKDLIDYLKTFDPETPVLIMENDTRSRGHYSYKNTVFKPLDFEADEQFFAVNGTLEIGNDS